METPQKIIASLPHAPGVYLYKDTTGTIIYVGKAKDLKRRVRQYFASDIEPGSKTAQLVSRIETINHIETHSEFDALILEAKLIREYNPKYNIIAKDDKSPLYLEITMDEELPRLVFVRKSSISDIAKRIYFGPFQSGRVLRQVLRQLRGIIPYCTQKRRDGRPCFYTHLGLCKPCPSTIALMPEGEERKRMVREYRTNIRRLSRILAGESLELLHDLEREMYTLAQEQQFEMAQSIKLSIDRLSQLLQKHYDPSFYTQGDSFLEHVYDSEMQELREVLAPNYPQINELHRIECIDISNTLGEFATGSMVVLSEGKPDPSSYRRFRIKMKNKPNDFAMIAEVVRRRFRHTEWAFPDVFVVDGGKGQVSSARETLATLGIDIPLIGLAKRFEEIIVPTDDDFRVIQLPLSSRALHMLERIRDESHRYALKYHRLLRKKGFLAAAV